MTKTTVRIISCVITETNFIFISDTGKQFSVPKGYEDSYDKLMNYSEALITEDYIDIPVEDLTPPKPKSIYDMFNELSKDIKLISARVDSLESIKVTVKDSDLDLSGISNHIKHAVEENNVIGVENLIIRLKEMNKVRSHSAEDLLNFLKHTDLPITDKGDILFYKKVKAGVSGISYDCHTGLIPQLVNTIISVDENLVDHDRTQDCSNGLHVASYKYARGFGGNRVLIGIVKPENIIAVPQYDHTKMRVSEYGILEYLDSEEFDAFCNVGITQSIKDKIKPYLDGFIPVFESKVVITAKTVRNKEDFSIEPLNQVGFTKTEEGYVPDLPRDKNGRFVKRKTTENFTTVKPINDIDDLVNKLKVNTNLHTPATEDVDKLLSRLKGSNQRFDSSVMPLHGKDKADLDRMFSAVMEISEDIDEVTEEHYDTFFALLKKYPNLHQIYGADKIELLHDFFTA